METVWDLFESCVRRTPGAVAVGGQRHQMYEDLHAAATVLSWEISTVGGPGQLVTLEASSPGTAVTAILAAARSRCPVLPVNGESPHIYGTAMIDDARPAIAVRERADGDFSVSSYGGGGPQDQEPSPSLADMRDVAYVMYTSGSTGRPKGVMVSHHALIDRLHAMAAVPGFGPGDSILAMSALTFDISMIEMLLPFITGGRLIAVPPATRMDPATFARVVHHHKPHVIQATPSFWRLALASGWGGAPHTRLWSGGEILTPALARKLLPRCAELWNIYGPTEGTLWATAAHVTAPEVIDLGRPLPGVGLFLENSDGTLITQARSTGEIVLYGDSLALGYLRRPELTSQRFVVRDLPEGTFRCYRTGDLAQFRPDSTLEFRGRADDQVKLRGHRIELTGLEAIAEEHPAVAEAAAVHRHPGDPKRAHIAMLVVPRHQVTTREIRQWMTERVPPGARPGLISIRSSLPRTPSGKIDRTALAAGPEPVASGNGGAS